MTGEATRLLRSAMHDLQLSARSYDKILKISRTVADLAESEEILPNHIAEATRQFNTVASIGSCGYNMRC